MDFLIEKFSLEIMYTLLIKAVIIWYSEFEKFRYDISSLAVLKKFYPEAVTFYFAYSFLIL